MKYIILIGDGMADRPLAELGNKTVLEASHTANIDSLLRQGKIGLTQNVPAGMHPGSDIACMSIFGYDPKKIFPGRAPLEAAAQNIKLHSDEVAFRCNLVTVENNKMKDFTAHHIKTAEAKKLIQKLNKKLGNNKIKFYPGVSYRHLVTIQNGPEKTKCTPPHDITGKDIKKYLPSGANSKLINNLMSASVEILKNEKTAATQIWLWGQGKAPKMETITKKYRIRGAVITAVDLLRGIGRYAGMEIIKVKGATGFIDTNYAGKVSAGLKALRKNDLLIIHVEAPDECGHMGDHKLKIKAIEDFDTQVVGPLIRQVRNKYADFRVLILPDHATPIELKTHSGEPVPFVYYDSTTKKDSGIYKYCEASAKNTKLKIPRGSMLMEKLIRAGF
jgi:2,3-bisphosphoglycerate-independent phosphoglycerate mutase